MSHTPRRAAPGDDSIHAWDFLDEPVEALPARGLGFLGDDDPATGGLPPVDVSHDGFLDAFLEVEAEAHVAPYTCTAAAAAVWAGVWEDRPVTSSTEVGDFARPAWRPRLTVAIAAAAVAVAAVPASVGLASPTTETSATPQATLPYAAGRAPAADPTTGSTPEPTVEQEPAPLPQPPATPMMLAAPTAPGPVTGIPRPCSIDLPFPATGSLAATVDRMERQWSVKLTGSQWRDERYRPVVRIFSETLDAVDCTDYLNRVRAGNGGPLEVNSGSTRSWAWGDYGLTRPGVLTLDLVKFRQGYDQGDRGRLVRLIVHEMAHSLNADRGGEPAYWQRFHPIWQTYGRPTVYGSNETEAFADAVGYYVARCAAENPYADATKKPYYDYVRTNIFGGREFGGPIATRQVCEGEGR